MQIIVSGKQIDIGKAFQEHAENKLTEVISKYLDRVSKAEVVASKEAHLFRVDITANAGTHAGLTIRGRASAGDIYAAFDAAVDKIEKQLRRYKRRITDHHKGQKAPEPAAEFAPVSGKKYVLADTAEEKAASEAPVVIAEKQTNIERLSVSEAVMKMDLSDVPALMFINSAHGRLNVVYRREDGNISWVDPASAEEAAA